MVFRGQHYICMVGIQFSVLMMFSCFVVVVVVVVPLIVLCGSGSGGCCCAGGGGGGGGRRRWWRSPHPQPHPTPHPTPAPHPPPVLTNDVVSNPPDPQQWPGEPWNLVLGFVRPQLLVPAL